MKCLVYEMSQRRTVVVFVDFAIKQIVSLLITGNPFRWKQIDNNRRFVPSITKTYLAQYQACFIIIEYLNISKTNTFLVTTI